MMRRVRVTLVDESGAPVLSADGHIGEAVNDHYLSRIPRRVTEPGFTVPHMWQYTMPIAGEPGPFDWAVRVEII